MDEREPTNEELKRELARLEAKRAAATDVASAGVPKTATENTWDKVQKLAGRAKKEYANSVKDDTKRLKNTAGAIRSGVTTLKKNLTLSPEDRSTWLAHTKAGLGVRQEDNAMVADREEMGDAKQDLPNLLEEEKTSWSEKNIPTLLAGLERIRNIRIGRSKNETGPDKEEVGGLVTEQDIQKAVEQLPPEDQKSILRGLLGIGFKVEKLKNNVLADATGFFARTNPDQDKYTTRFMKELSDSFKRDAKNADKRARDMAKGEGNWKTNLMSPALLAGNIYKYGRIITDITGKTASLPFRYVTMIGMGISRLSEAGKEAHLKTEAVSEKTRIKNSEDAADEAWSIYKKTIAIMGGEISGEELQNIYVSKLPQDLLRRLQQPATASNFIQKFVKWDIQKAIERLDKNIKKIEQNKKYTTEQKEKKKLELLNGIQWKNALRDYDRMITEFGTVDEIATSAIYMKAVGRGLVGGALAGAIEVSLPKIWENISHAISKSDVYETLASAGTSDSVKITPDSLSVPDIQTDITPAEVPETATPGSESMQPAIFEQQPAPPVTPEPAPTTPTTNTPSPAVNPDAIVHKGQGITHAFAAQIKADHDLAERLGFTGDFNNKKDIANFTKELAIKTGYMDEQGLEVRVAEADKVAYEIKMENGRIVVDEKTVDGQVLETHREGDMFEDKPDKHEYGYRKPEIETSIGEEALRNPASESATMFEPAIPEPTPAPVDNQAAIDSVREQVLSQMDKGTPSPVVEGVTPEAPVAEGAPAISTDNPFNLSPEMIQEVNQVYNDSIAKMFPRGWEQVWENVRNNPAERLFMVRELGESREINALYHTNFPTFVHKLYDISGLRPISETWLRSAETNEEYIKRALQFIAANIPNKLDEIKL